MKTLFITYFSIWEARLQAVKEGGAHFSFPAGGEGQARSARYTDTVGNTAAFKDRFVFYMMELVPATGSTGGSSPTPSIAVH